MQNLSEPRTYNLSTISEVGVAMVEDRVATVGWQEPEEIRAELYHRISDALLNEETITLDEGGVLVSEYDRASGTVVHPDRRSGGSLEHTQILPEVHGYHAETAQDRPEIAACVLQQKVPGAIIDKLVSAEGSDKEVNPDLYKTVMACMMHGPCVLIFKHRQYDNETVNQWAVPYNPYLCQKYDYHINVEVCTTIGAIKFLYKYVYKGSDRAVLTIEAVRDPSEPRSEPNEILRFLNARYISPVEVAMRLLTYQIQGKTHAVTTLTVHLEGGQMVVFQQYDDPDRMLGRAGSTMLTSFVELCASTEPEDEIAKTMFCNDAFRVSGEWLGVDCVHVRGIYFPDVVPAATGICHNVGILTSLCGSRTMESVYDELARDFAYTYRNIEGQTKEDMITFHTLKNLNDLLQISGQAVAGFDLPQLSD
ncbi:unnamed protein product [Phytophthora fragariaefolia]|uniref:Unnamed protein product n=1 Tax=Phytophthora fragariaefolia TaxID=1490495 RepID=A0A9W6XJF3_9STRA|nr:unnamed protein product [Phytophthora fragariaefolia]